MPTSLHELLSQHGFRRANNPPKPDVPPPAPAAAPTSLSLCRDRHSIDLLRDSQHHKSNHRRSRSIGSLSLLPKSSHASSSASVSRSRDEEPVGDDAAAHAVVSVLSSYLGRYLKDRSFRMRLREKCEVCFAGRDDNAHKVFVNLQMGMENVDRLAESGGACKESNVRSLRSSVRLLSIVVAADSSRTKNGYTCGVPNSHLSACAHLYLSIIYKMEKNDKGAARHLLQVFCDAPYISRKSLLPDLWDQFFLPHLLHLKVWYNKEVEMLSVLDAVEKDRATKGLNRVYNDQMDLGTAQFALYFKGWLKGDERSPVTPSVSLPSRSAYHAPVGKKSFPVSPCTTNRCLYQAVFRHENKKVGGKDASVLDIRCPESEAEAGIEACEVELGETVHTDHAVPQRSTSSMQDNAMHGSHTSTHRSYSLRLFSCQNDSDIGNLSHNQIPKKEPHTACKETNAGAPLLNLSRAISIISSSNNISECETAVRLVARALSDSQENSILWTALSSGPVIEGMLEVLLMSKNEEVLELSISTLAELVTRNEVNRQVILNADPQLEIFMRLLASHSLFLKVAILLYLLRPKAKQMLSREWIPLVLRVLDHGEHTQILFSAKCSPKTAALYLLDQLLLGFDVDRNVENARQVVSLGGLRLLIRWLEMGDGHECRSAASLLTMCVQADGNCREFLAVNIKKKAIIDLLVGNQLRSNGCALMLLTEVLCLGRRTQITKFLTELKSEGCLNAMHILLVYLQQAPAEQQPLIAAILLQLDIMGDPLQYSFYREEAIDAIIRALDCTNSRKIKEQCSRALLVLAGRFTSTGASLSESWLLKRAGLDDGPSDLYAVKEVLDASSAKPDEKDQTEEWLGRLATVLITRGHKHLLIALSNCVAYGIPILTRSCLVTVAWMTNSLEQKKNSDDLLSLACSVLTPRLLECLRYDRVLEERILAALSLFNFSSNSDCLSKMVPLSRDSEGLLRDLSRFTWTAKEVLFHAANCSNFTSEL